MRRARTDAERVAVVADAINATVALERAQSSAGDRRQRPRYERAVTKLVTMVLDREPTKEELETVFE